MMEHEVEAGRRETVVPVEAGGQRLDRAVELLWPEVGLRGRRRLIESGAVLVDGRTRDASYRVRAGQRLEEAPREPQQSAFTAADIRVLTVAGDFAAVSKPAGLHTASIAHGGGENLEELLPAVFPGRSPILLSRLDRLTSGIVPVAFTEAAGQEYRRLEDAGQVGKTYLAVCHGEIDAPFTVDFRLDMADRVRTRVRPQADPDALRHTRVEPVERGCGLTLVSCRIAKGARHQIRAHMAASGHPLVGDPVYGKGGREEGSRLFLHCSALRAPVLDADDPPPWTLATAVAVVTDRAQKEKGQGKRDTDG